MSVIVSTSKSSCRLNNLEPLGNHFLDFLVFVLEEAQSVCNVIPCPLAFSSRQPSSKFVGELFSVFVLFYVSLPM
jgi:hypothetical protein